MATLPVPPLVSATPTPTPAPARAAPRAAPAVDLPRLAIRAGYALAALLGLISLGGLALDATYARETEAWRAQAYAQDVFDLAIAAPSLVIATALALRGSRRARLVLAGLYLFTVYTLAIYAFAVHLNALFLPYCAGLGVGLYALIGVAVDLARTPREALAERHPRRAAGGYLIAVGGVFALLWLGQLVPAARTGTVPPELAATGLLTNPVHVLDLAFILPLHVIAGVALLRRRPIGRVLAPVVLAFGAWMAASIAFLAGDAGAPEVAIALGVIALAATTLLIALLRGVED